jgi:hypothetical protein
MARFRASGSRRARLRFLHRCGTKWHQQCAMRWAVLPKNAVETPNSSELLNAAPIGSSTVTTKSLSFIEACRYFAGDGDKQRVCFKAKSDYAVGELTSEGIAALLAALKGTTEPVTAIFEGYGGAINRIAPPRQPSHTGALLGIACNTFRSGPQARRRHAESKLSAISTRQCALIFRGFHTSTILTLTWQTGPRRTTRKI